MHAYPTRDKTLGIFICMFVPHNEWNFSIIHLHPTSDRTLPIFMMFVPHNQWNSANIHLWVCTPVVIELYQYPFACLCHTTSATLASFIYRFAHHRRRMKYIHFHVWLLRGGTSALFICMSVHYKGWNYIEVCISVFVWESIYRIASALLDICILYW